LLLPRPRSGDGSAILRRVSYTWITSCPLACRPDFGARVVTAAADGPVPLIRSSLALQGAVSHNGFTAHFDGRHDGFFRKVVAGNKIGGPIIVTHTVNDKAVGIAYPIASRISGDKTSALGDEGDVYGGLGRNGAVKMKANEYAAGVLLGQDGRYLFTVGKAHNLRADDYVSSHGVWNDVHGAGLSLAAAPIIASRF